jgi:ribosome modulation factor
MRDRLTRASLQGLMRELAGSAGKVGHYDVYLVGGGTAVLKGWRESSVDADLYAARDDIFRDVQDIKERLRLNIELVRPEDFVPPLEGSPDRHVFIETVGRVSYYHYDPCSQLLSKVVRGFDRDMSDARAFVSSGMVDAGQFRRLVRAIPDSAWSKYPRHSPAAVREAVDQFLSSLP